jgi:hypothetical protein
MLQSFDKVPRNGWGHGLTSEKRGGKIGHQPDATGKTPAEEIVEAAKTCDEMHYDHERMLNYVLRRKRKNTRRTVSR